MPLAIGCEPLSTHPPISQGQLLFRNMAFSLAAEGPCREENSVRLDSQKPQVTCVFYPFMPFRVGH